MQFNDENDTKNIVQHWSNNKINFFLKFSLKKNPSDKMENHLK